VLSEATNTSSHKERTHQPSLPTISAVVISCNDADVIEPCLRSVADWVDDIVVVDMHSADGTREIAARYHARVVDHERLSYADPARNFALSQAIGEWIIMMDPDERVPVMLAHELQRIAMEGMIDVVEIPFRTVIFGHSMQAHGVSDQPHPRFFRAGVISWPSEIHGRPELAGLRCYTIPSYGPAFAIHHDTWRSVPIVLDKIARYAPQDVENLRQQQAHFSLVTLLSAIVGGFANRMLEGRAYEDGMPGLLASLYWSVYDLTIHAELWEAEGRTQRFDKHIMRWGRRLTPLYLGLRGAKRFTARVRTRLGQGQSKR